MICQWESSAVDSMQERGPRPIILVSMFVLLYFGFILNFCPWKWSQLGARWAHRKWGSNSDVWLPFFSELAAGRFSSTTRKSKQVVEAEGGSAESNFASILNNCYPTAQMLALPVPNCTTIWRKPVLLTKMLKPFTATWVLTVSSPSSSPFLSPPSISVQQCGWQSWCFFYTTFS